jgi:hypothetical protein
MESDGGGSGDSWTKKRSSRHLSGVDIAEASTTYLAEASSTEDFFAKHAKFPMFVASVPAVLELSQFMPFQEMNRLGLVRPLDPEKDIVVIFVTHQCTSLGGMCIAQLRSSSSCAACEQGPPMPTQTTPANSYAPYRASSGKWSPVAPARSATASKLWPQAWVQRRSSRARP